MLTRRVQIVVILLSDWATVAITLFHHTVRVAPWSELWCLIHGQSNPYERTLRGTESNHGLTRVNFDVSVSCRSSNLWP